MHAPAIATYIFAQVFLTIFELALLVFWVWIATRVLIEVLASEDLSD